MAWMGFATQYVTARSAFPEAPSFHAQLHTILIQRKGVFPRTSVSSFNLACTRTDQRLPTSGRGTVI